jgi:hypothetical protein
MARRIARMINVAERAALACSGVWLPPTGRKFLTKLKEGSGKRHKAFVPSPGPVTRRGTEMLLCESFLIFL